MVGRRSLVDEVGSEADVLDSHHPDRVVEVVEPGVRASGRQDQRRTGAPSFRVRRRVLRGPRVASRRDSADGHGLRGSPRASPRRGLPPRARRASRKRGSWSWPLVWTWQTWCWRWRASSRSRAIRARLTSGTNVVCVRLDNAPECADACARSSTTRSSPNRRMSARPRSVNPWVGVSTPPANSFAWFEVRLAGPEPPEPQFPADWLRPRRGCGDFAVAR